MKKFISILIITLVLVIGFFTIKNKMGTETTKNNMIASSNEISVRPVAHATFVLSWGDAVIYNDPTGGAGAFQNQPPANIILVSDIHGDHLNADTLSAVMGNAAIFVPQAVKDQLPAGLAERSRVLANGETVTEQGFSLTAIPMYNFPESENSRHTKGRGNGYVIERDGRRVYIAGDTAGIPEMRALLNIDIAFIPMNLPFTMGVDEAASAVLEFKPKKIYPYHYRGQDGIADTNRFKELINAGNPAIEVVLMDWYPQ